MAYIDGDDIKPNIYLSGNEAKTFADYQVDDEFEITARVRVASKTKRNQKDMNGRVKPYVSLDLELSDLKVNTDVPRTLMSNEERDRNG